LQFDLIASSGQQGHIIRPVETWQGFEYIHAVAGYLLEVLTPYLHRVFPAVAQIDGMGSCHSPLADEVAVIDVAVFVFFGSKLKRLRTCSPEYKY